MDGRERTSSTGMTSTARLKSRAGPMEYRYVSHPIRSDSLKLGNGLGPTMKHRAFLQYNHTTPHPFAVPGGSKKFRYVANYRRSRCVRSNIYRLVVLYTIESHKNKNQQPAIQNTLPNYQTKSQNTDMSVRQFIESENAKHQVVIWSKSYCPYCTSAKNLLQNSATNVQIYELDRMSNGNDIQNELYQMTRQRTVPNVFIKNQHVGGNDDCQHLHRTGQLKEMLP